MNMRDEGEGRIKLVKRDAGWVSDLLNNNKALILPANPIWLYTYYDPISPDYLAPCSAQVSEQRPVTPWDLC